MTAVPAPADSPKKPLNRKTVLWIVAIGFFMETLDSTIVNTALPAMATSLHENPLSMHSVVIGYTLTLAALIPVSGWIADRFGIRATFLTAICLFCIGSISCAMSHSLGFLVASRVFQGVGGSMLLPVGRLTILRMFPKDEFLDAMSFVAVPALIGPLIGPTLGGFLVEYASWHWIFLINVPVSFLGIYATLKWMPVVPTYQVRRFDVKGFIMLTTMMVAFSLALEGISDFGFGHATVMTLVALGFAGITAYFLHASHDKRAIFPISVFKTRTFTIGLLGNLFARLGSAAMPFLIPLLLQVSLGYSPVQSGSTMIPIAAAAILSRRYATPLILSRGYRTFLLRNTFVLGAIIASLALVTLHMPPTLRVILLIVYGTVNSLQFSAMNSLTLKDLAGRETASGNSMLSMIQMLAMSFGVANAGALLTTFSRYFTAEGKSTAHAFQATFICLGVITAFSAWVFAQLSEGPYQGRKPPEVPAT